jgi:hypothetical protein
LQQLDQIVVRLYLSRYDSAISVDAALDFNGERTLGGEPSAISPGGNSMCGSPSASAPPRGATLGIIISVKALPPSMGRTVGIGGSNG